jgi:mono/diheme cytochrome c family protein
VFATFVGHRDANGIAAAQTIGEDYSAHLASAELHVDLVVPFLETHCAACHGPEDENGGLRIDQLRTDFATPNDAGKWIEVMDQINLGQMPPQSEPRPDIDELRSVTRWIAEELRHADRTKRSTGGRALLRRLSRTEYTNTIRDLLSVDFLPDEGPANLLPPDGTAEGFTKVSSALMLDPSLLEKYFEAAQMVADKVLVDGPPEFPTEVMRYELEETANNRAIRYLVAKPGIELLENGLALMNGSTRSFGVMKYPGTKQEIPTKGLYRIRVRAWSQHAKENEPVIMRFTQNHPQADQERLIETEVTSSPQVFEVVLPRDPKSGEYNVSIVNGSQFDIANRIGLEIRDQQQVAGQAKDFERVIRLQSRQQLEALTWSKPNPESARLERLPKLIVDWIECEGPLVDQWPPRSHQRLLAPAGQIEDPEEAIDAIFRELMPRAFRRPVSESSFEAITNLAKSELAAGESFHRAIGTGLTAVLCSPRFLYLLEPTTLGTVGERQSLSADGVDPRSDNTPALEMDHRPLDHWEIASRLSYLLWSSLPDARLFELADQGRLADRATLEAEVDRMLGSPQADGFVRDFGAQWIRTEEFLTFTPDDKLYKQYDAGLGKAMVAEPLAFFETVLKEDLSLLSFVDADWAMVNERLADFYGLEGVQGDEFRKVPLPADSPRGGLLGMAGVALRGSDGNRTKPVNRGVYVRDVLFNDPPDPPPPNAGEVEPNIRGERLTVRERLEQHQHIESCAACHRSIDCYGFALENFNAIGDWRERQDGESFRGNKTPVVDVSGTLPNGQAFGSFEEFKELLKDQEIRIARGFTEKMLVYALGRPVESSDRALIDRLTQKMQSEGFTIRSLLKGLVASEAFLTK